VWKDGSLLEVTVKSQTDVRVHLYGGTDRTNASINATFNNGSLNTGQTYSLDVSSGAVLLALPVVNKQNGGYEFSFKVKGEQYSWWEKWIVGPNG